MTKPKNTVLYLLNAVNKDKWKCKLADKNISRVETPATVNMSSQKESKKRKAKERVKCI